MNIKSYCIFLFQFLKGVNKKLIVYDKIAKILKKTFELNDELNEKIKNYFKFKPRIIEINNKKFLENEKMKKKKQKK